MAIIEDLIDELYTLDNSRWYENVSSILGVLNFPVEWEYTCNWQEFIYERSGKSDHTTSKDRKTLTRCREIACFRIDKWLKKIKVFAILIEGNTKTKNETVYYVSKVFNRLYGRFVVLIFVFRDDIAFAGTALLDNNKTEIVISDWFGCNRDEEVNRELLEIDFSLFEGKNYKQIYENYLWAISRKYVRYQESKMYLIYGCGEPIKTEGIVFNEREEEWEEVERIDRESTLYINSRYYLDDYDNDYFLDESGTNYNSSDELLENDNEDFEWTMLEMELEDETDIEESEEDDFDELTDYQDYEAYDMDPNEMLQYIRNNHDS